MITEIDLTSKSARMITAMMIMNTLNTLNTQDRVSVALPHQ